MPSACLDPPGPRARAGRLLSAVLLAGCGGEATWDYACEQSCGRLFAADACALEGDAGGADYRGCTQQCQSAHGVSGEVRGIYDPYTATDPDLTFTNAAEAELWRACVDETPCTDLRAGACPPTF